MPIQLSLQEINPCIRSVGQDFPTRALGPKRIIYDYEMIYCHKGQIAVHYDDFLITFGPGEIGIIVPGVFHRLDYARIEEVYWVHFDFFYHNNQDDVARYIHRDKEKALSDQGYSASLARSEIMILPNFSVPESFITPDSDTTRQTFLQLIDLFHKKNFGWQIQAKAQMHRLIYLMLDHLVITDNSPSNYIQLTQAVISYIKEHSYRKVASSELANQFHYHPDTLNRIVHKTTQKSISTHIKEIRIDKVKHLLIYASMTLDEIAFHCGFNDRSHLIKTFKMVAHCTPSDYKSHVQKNVLPEPNS